MQIPQTFERKSILLEPQSRKWLESIISGSHFEKTISRDYLFQQFAKFDADHSNSHSQKTNDDELPLDSYSLNHPIIQALRATIGEESNREIQNAFFVTLGAAQQKIDPSLYLIEDQSSIACFIGLLEFHSLLFISNNYKQYLIYKKNSDESLGGSQWSEKMLDRIEEHFRRSDTNNIKRNYLKIIRQHKQQESKEAISDFTLISYATLGSGFAATALLTALGYTSVSGCNLLVLQPLFMVVNPLLLVVAAAAVGGLLTHFALNKSRKKYSFAESINLFKSLDYISSSELFEKPNYIQKATRAFCQRNNTVPGNKTEQQSLWQSSEFQTFYQEFSIVEETHKRNPYKMFCDQLRALNLQIDDIIPGY